MRLVLGLRQSFPFFAVMVGLCVLACGSRSGVLDAETLTSGGSGGMGGGSGGTGGSSASGGSGGGAAGQDVVCPLEVRGGPQTILQFADASALSPDAALAFPGAATRDAEVAVFAVASDAAPHTDNRAVLLGFAATAVKTLKTPKVFGIESHSYGFIARSQGEAQRFLVTWVGDHDGKTALRLRSVNGETWQGGPIKDMGDAAGTPQVLEAGAGVSLAGGHSGNGYFLAFRHQVDKSSSELRVGVLSESGTQTSSFHPVAKDGSSSSSRVAAVWSGKHYLIARTSAFCLEVDGLCKDRSVILLRYRPASGDLFDDSGIDYAGEIQPLSTASRPLAPSMSAHEDSAYVAFGSGKFLGDQEVRVVRAARLSASGQVLARVNLQTQRAVESAVTVHASRFGVSLAWLEDGEPTLSNGSPGRSRLVLRHLTHNLEPMGDELVVPITKGTSSPIRLTSFRRPEQIVAVWGGTSPASSRSVVFAARFACATP